MICFMLSYQQLAELNPFVQWARQVEGLAELNPVLQMTKKAERLAEARKRLDEALRNYVAVIS